MTSQSGQLAVPLHILRNILGNKSNQTMRFGSETIPRLFPKKPKLSIYLDQ